VSDIWRKLVLAYAVSVIIDGFGDVGEYKTFKNPICKKKKKRKKALKHKD